MTECGVEFLSDNKSIFEGKRIGLLTNQTGRDKKGRTTAELLRELCGPGLTALFGPEHGIRGAAGAGDSVKNERDRRTGLMAYSLYGGGDNPHFTEEMLSLFNVLVYDIQDVGVRFYTYISTLYNALCDCAAAGKELVILDRPDPLGGTVTEGGRMRDEYRSFVGCFPMPVRYGLTCGEAAMMMNDQGNLGCDLTVIPCAGWNRNLLFPEWGRIWDAPSTALLNYESALFYPGTGLFEGTNLSEGRGTAAPFRAIGADYVDGDELSGAFNKCGLPGVEATPLWFTPSDSKYRGVPCGGILLHVTDIHAMRPVTVGITLLDVIRTLYPGKYGLCKPDVQDGRSGRSVPMLARLSGSGELLGNWDRGKVLEDYEEYSSEFAETSRRYHIY